ncbi:MAG: hypothetical protein ACKV2Q_03775 [Planctomycetaceae bacterium]
MSLSEKLSRRIELFRDEVEQWQDAHAEAMACLDLQDTLAFGLSVYHQIGGAEAAWYASVDAGQIPFNEPEETAFGQLYSLWLTPCEQLLAKIQRFETAGFQVEGATEFRVAINQARYSAWTGPLSAEANERIQRFQSLSADELAALAKRHPPPASWFDEEDLS